MLSTCKMHSYKLVFTFHCYLVVKVLVNDLDEILVFIDGFCMFKFYCNDCNILSCKYLFKDL